MRLDLYLKKSRIIKRRTQAKILIDNNLVTLNDKIAKPSNLVKVDDIIKITTYNRLTTYKVLSLETIPMFTIMKEEKRILDVK